MLDTIMDGLGYVGDALSAPGDYLRGAVTGRLGERANGRQLLDALGVSPGDGLGGDIAGFATEVATDPLTILGGLGGRLLGRSASKAAAARGPGYATTLDDLERMAIEGGSPGLANIEALRSNPAAARIASEVPPASTFLGSGAEAMAFTSPGGDVVRIGNAGAGEKGRPVAQGILQATRGVDVPAGVSGDLLGPLVSRVERVPMADGVGVPGMFRRDPRTMLKPVDTLDETLAGQGLKFTDRHSGNLGMYGGQPVVIDPGAVAVSPGFAGGHQPVTTAKDPGLLMRALLGAIDGQGQTRAAIEAGLAGPDFTMPLTLAGGGLGSVGGAFSRAGRQ